MRILVTGGVRSGKSTHAEALIGDEPATYVAPGPTPDAEADADWAARVAAHRARRPASWATLETQDLVDAIRGAEHPVLVDCLGTWLTAVIDAEDAWERILAGATLVQGYSAFVYEGPFWARAIHKGLAARLRTSPYATLADAVGADVRKTV